MGRLSRPLNRDAVKAADDEFYANHPELVKNGKRIPLSATDPRQNEWLDLYKKYGGKEEDDIKKASPKKPAASVQSCPHQKENWIKLEYLYCDGTGVAGAHYRVINNDDGAIVAQGTLDANGYAFCALPLPVNNVSYDFDKDPLTVSYLRQPTPNPELPKVTAGWFDRVADGIADTGSWIWGTVQGDFNEDQTIGQIATNAAITMIPIVDQVGDVRDIVANLKFLIWDKRYDDKWVWIALVLTLIGLIPVLGSAAKGVLKTVAKALKTGGKAPLKLLIEVLNKFHKGNAVKWLRKLAADLPSHAATMKGKFRDILKSLRDKLQSLAKFLSGSLGKEADDAVNSVDEVAKVADGKIDEAVKELQDGLNKSLDEGVDFEKKGATKTQNIRKQTDAEPPPLPESVSTKVKPTGRGRSGERTKINPDDDLATKRSLKRENEAADTLANEGYTVEQNPPKQANGKKPDYRIEGEYFDCYSPSKDKKPRGIWSEIETKVSNEQADRIVLNLDDWDGDISALRKQFNDWPIKNLQEVLIVKNGKVFPL